MCFGNSTVQMVLYKFNLFTFWHLPFLCVFVFIQFLQIKCIIFLLKLRSFGSLVQDSQQDTFQVVLTQPEGAVTVWPGSQLLRENVEPMHQPPAPR